MAAILGTLGALLLGTGVIAFVGANWEEMPRIFRFGVLVAAMAAAYLVAALLARPGLRVFSEAGLLVAGLIFAAAIALVGQTYHLAGDFAGAVLMWEVGVLGAAVLTSSPSLTVLALAGSSYWTWLVVIEQQAGPHWGSLVTVLIGAVLAIWLNLAYVRLLAVLALCFWIVVNIVGLADWLEWSLMAGMAVIASAALLLWGAGSALTALAGQPRLVAFGRAMLWPSLAGLLIVLAILQTSIYWGGRDDGPFWLEPAGAGVAAGIVLAAFALVRRAIGFVDLAAALVIGLAAIGFAHWHPADVMSARLIGGVIVLGAALFVVNLGQTSPQRIGKKLGLAAFGLEIIYLYVMTLGTLLDTAVAFLLGGLLFIVLAYGLYKVDRRLSAAGASA